MAIGFAMPKIMPRPNRIFQSDYPYHVTCRSNNRDHFVLNTRKLWSFSSDLLLFSTYAFKIEIHSYVLMDNHYHMIVRTPEANISNFMYFFNKEFSREIGFQTSKINHRFGARYHATVIDDLRYYHNAYKYVYRNPIEAGLSKTVQDYEFSSLGFHLNREIFRFPVFDSYFESVPDVWPNLDWLNAKYPEHEFQKIKSALRKSRFTLA